MDIFYSPLSLSGLDPDLGVSQSQPPLLSLSPSSQPPPLSLSLSSQAPVTSPSQPYTGPEVPPFPPAITPPLSLTPSPPAPVAVPSRLQASPSIPATLLPPLVPTPNRSGQFEAPQSAIARLQAIYGPATSWRSQEQMDAVKALLQVNQDVIVALPTGLGKSLIALLPSQLEAGITVIFIPLKALMEDWKRRLNDLKVDFEQFEGANRPHLDGNCNIVLVSFDVARHAAWRKAIGYLQTRRPVVRFVFDECHYFFAEPGFRQKVLEKPWKLRTLFPCQFVLLSATLPPSARDFLTDEMALVRPITIAATSARPELRYHVSQVGEGSFAEEIMEVVDNCTNSLNWGPKDRYLIFVRSKLDGEILSKKLKLEFYSADARDRQKLMDNWTTGRKLGMVCTVALSAGHDYSNVRLTIHAGTPANMIAFGQQAGRAGRDGKEAWCRLLCNKPPPYTEDPHNLLGISELKALVKDGQEWPKNCPRFAQSQAIDGDGRHCLQLPSHYLPCNACGKFSLTLDYAWIHPVRRAPKPSSRT